MKRKLVAEITDNFASNESLSAIFVDGFDIKELQNLADALHKKSGGIRAVFSGSESEFFFAICGEANALDIWFKEFKSKLNIRGGGRNGIVQGTCYATKESILGVINELD